MSFEKLKKNLIILKRFQESIENSAIILKNQINYCLFIMQFFPVDLFLFCYFKALFDETFSI